MSAFWIDSLKRALGTPANHHRVLTRKTIRQYGRVIIEFHRKFRQQLGHFRRVWHSVFANTLRQPGQAKQCLLHRMLVHCVWESPSISPNFSDAITEIVVSAVQSVNDRSSCFDRFFRTVGHQLPPITPYLASLRDVVMQRKPSICTNRRFKIKQWPKEKKGNAVASKASDGQMPSLNRFVQSIRLGILVGPPFDTDIVSQRHRCIRHHRHRRPEHPHPLRVAVSCRFIVAAGSATAVGCTAMTARTRRDSGFRQMISLMKFKTATSKTGVNSGSATKQDFRLFARVARRWFHGESRRC